jgi:hypothetical protein
MKLMKEANKTESSTNSALGKISLHLSFTEEKIRGATTLSARLKGAQNEEKCSLI